MQLVEKAWEISRSHFNSWEYPDEVFYSDNRNSARYQALRSLKENGWDEDRWGEQFTYKKLKVVRTPEYDKFMFEGELKTQKQIDIILEWREWVRETDQLLSDNPGAYCYIKKGGYYYKPNSCGYTEFTANAGIYPIEKAAKIVKSCSLSDHMRMIVIDKKEHNDMILEKITELQSKLIVV